MAEVPSHHFIYGHCPCYITGETLVDTDDERYRQKLARFMVEKKGYSKREIEPRIKIETLFNGQFVTSKIDLVVSIQNKRCMIIRYGPGSLVTRERPALAAARVLDPNYQVPLSVVTNGEDAELLDTTTGKVLATGMDSIPCRDDLVNRFDSLHFLPPLDASKKERDLRILNAFDVEICCAGGPCALPNASEGAKK